MALVLYVVMKNVVITKYRGNKEISEKSVGGSIPQIHLKKEIMENNFWPEPNK